MGLNVSAAVPTQLLPAMLCITTDVYLFILMATSCPCAVLSHPCRQLKDQVLAAIQNKQHALTVEISSRTRHRALQQLEFAGIS
jgi:hypothetical protein